MLLNTLSLGKFKDLNILCRAWVHKNRLQLESVIPSYTLLLRLTRPSAIIAGKRQQSVVHISTSHCGNSLWCKLRIRNSPIGKRCWKMMRPNHKRASYGTSWRSHVIKRRMVGFVVWFGKIEWISLYSTVTRIPQSSNLISFWYWVNLCSVSFHWYVYELFVVRWETSKGCSFWQANSLCVAPFFLGESGDDGVLIGLVSSPCEHTLSPLVKVVL